jgi:hypothetical protein
MEEVIGSIPIRSTKTSNSESAACGQRLSHGSSQIGAR